MEKTDQIKEYLREGEYILYNFIEKNLSNINTNIVYDDLYVYNNENKYKIKITQKVKRNRYDKLHVFKVEINKNNVNKISLELNDELEISLKTIENYKNQNIVRNITSFDEKNKLKFMPYISYVNEEENNTIIYKPYKDKQYLKLDSNDEFIKGDKNISSYDTFNCSFDENCIFSKAIEEENYTYSDTKYNNYVINDIINSIEDLDIILKNTKKDILKSFKEHLKKSESNKYLQSLVNDIIDNIDNACEDLMCEKDMFDENKSLLDKAEKYFNKNIKWSYFDDDELVFLANKIKEYIISTNKLFEERINNFINELNDEEKRLVLERLIKSSN